MFNVTEDKVLGYPLGRVLDDPDEFLEVWEKNEPRNAEGKEYPRHGLFVRRLLFPIKEENVIAGIMVNLTGEWKRQREMLSLKHQTVDEISNVITKQMQIAQEIARLLGETTAESKIALNRLMGIVNKEVL
jgi:uncharacterized Fe-S cluster-containing protein